MQSTTSTLNSGFFDYILPIINDEIGIDTQTGFHLGSFERKNDIEEVAFPPAPVGSTVGIQVPIRDAKGIKSSNVRGDDIVPLVDVRAPVSYTFSGKSYNFDAGEFYH